MKKIFLAALALRLILAPVAHHGDVFEFLNWGKNLEELELQGFYLRDTPDAGDPNYPPVFYHILLANQWAYQAAKNLLWQINVLIPPFPSGVYTWFAQDSGRIFFNKLLAILGDLGIGYFVYRWVREIKSKKAGIVASAAFLFSPPIWYNSSVWGSTESIFSLPLIASFYALYRKQLVTSSLLYTLSFLIRPTVLLVLPVFALWWLKSAKPKSLFHALLANALFFYAVHIPFQENTLTFIAHLYRYDIREYLGYLVANAFNFWALIFGFEPRSYDFGFLGLPAYLWGFLLVGLFTIYFLLRLNEGILPKKVFLSSALLSFAGFLFLARIHERYFYFTLLFLAPLVAFDRRVKHAFWALSAIHLLNLYHFWWVPRIEVLIELLSTRIVEQVIIVVNIGVFFWLLRLFHAKYAKATT